jgi:hypothetical protein
MRHLFALLFLACASNAFAHDFWIEPSNFHPKDGELVTLQLRVGHFDESERVFRNAAKIQQFVAIGVEGSKPVTGVDGRDPAGYLRWTADHPGLVAYEGKPHVATLSPALFRRYLAEERLSRPAKMPKGNVRDHFSRSARLLFPDAGDTWRKPAGLTLEIVPESDPWREEALKVQLLFEGKPLAGAAVTAIDRMNVRREVHARTDGDGRASLQLAGRGPWLVKTVHARQVAKDEYRSWWGSLVFSR